MYQYLPLRRVGTRFIEYTYIDDSFILPVTLFTVSLQFSTLVFTLALLISGDIALHAFLTPSDHLKQSLTPSLLTSTTDSNHGLASHCAPVRSTCEKSYQNAVIHPNARLFLSSIICASCLHSSLPFYNIELTLLILFLKPKVLP